MSYSYGKMMKREEILKKEGWTVECHSPFEIRHSDGSFATGQAANIIFQSIIEENLTEDDLIQKLIEDGFPEGHNLRGDDTSGLVFAGLSDMLSDTFVFCQGVDVNSLETLAKLAKVRCLNKAPKNEPQINWPTGVEDEKDVDNGIKLDQSS